MEKYSLFHLEGGVGKNITATAVAKCIKNNYPDRKLIIVCPYPEIFLNLKFIDRVYKIGKTSYFYDDYIKDKDTLIFRHEPYFTTEHIHHQLPLIENWCKLFGLKYTGEKPELLFNMRQKQFGRAKWKRNKPIMLIHVNGGPFYDQSIPYSWIRDLPPDIPQQVINHFKDQYHIIQICRKSSPMVQEVESITEAIDNMTFLSLLLSTEKRLLIDSCLQHAAYALNLPSTVTWVGTPPKVFGYQMHNNIIANIPKGIKLPNSYLLNYNGTGVLHECPFIDEEIFNVNEIINSLEK